MKSKLTPFGGRARRSARAVPVRPAAERRARSDAPYQERGVALIITLILLVVITTLAVAFLALSTRETAAVSSTISTTDAEQATHAALERAQAQIAAPFFAKNTVVPTPPPPHNGSTNNEIMGPDIMVSVSVDTNRLNSAGMFRNPSPPVFIGTNRSTSTSGGPAPSINPQYDDRFYLDLNRNQRFDATGFLPISSPGAQGSVGYFIGDPQWIGILRDPTRPHAPDNQFISRYAFLILPAGRTLDMNWIHNQAITSGTTRQDYYFRNQGIGCYEMNLAAFLADLNPNYWNTNYWPGAIPYDSRFISTFGCGGDAFADALEFLYYRYGTNNLSRLSRCRQMFASLSLPGVTFFPRDGLDFYCDGPQVLFGGSAATIAAPDNEFVDRPWSGSDSVQHFYSIHDFWDAAKLSSKARVQSDSQSRFIERLRAASTSNFPNRDNTSDRTTYYRLLAQLGTDSAAEKDDRLNVNFENIDTNSSTLANVKGSSTNFVEWTTSNFFHAAADRMLTNEFFPLGLTNIGLLGGRSIPIYARTNSTLGAFSAFGVPVASSGTNTIFANSAYPIYSPRIHQILQIALNIFEATQTNQSYAWPTLPNVLRPIFDRRNANEIHIIGYVEENRSDFRQRLASLQWHEIDNAPASFSNNDNLYDIPVLLGARKGMPNFNEFTLHTYAEFSRNIEVHKNPAGRKISTNQTLTVSIVNNSVAEMFNSYGEITNFYSSYPNAQYTYPRDLELFFQNIITTAFTNDGVGNDRVVVANTVTNAQLIPYPLNTWTNGFRLTQLMSNLVLAPSVLYMNPTGHFQLYFNNLTQSDPILRPYTNRWGMIVSNRVRCFLFDSGRLVDCFASARLISQFDINRELEARFGTEYDKVWNRAERGNVSEGVSNQIRISLGLAGQNSSDWVNYGGLNGYPTISAAVQTFTNFMYSTAPVTNPVDLVKQAGFSPIVRLLHISTWQANDPLVHGTVYDLYSPERNYSSVWRPAKNTYNFYVESTFGQDQHPGENAIPPTLGKVNERYKPWGRPDRPEDYRWTEKDSGVFAPDYWDFPAQKFPNLGWLGRVHRGTPWQTVYLKADDPSYSGTLLAGVPTGNDWWRHTGAAFMTSTFPTNDWKLLDLFTAAVHPNATRGRLSINQTNLAAWSAVFSGVPVTTVLGVDSSVGYRLFETNIQPVSADTLQRPLTNSPLRTLYQGINAARRAAPGGQFRKLSDFMSVSELTYASPFLTPPVVSASMVGDRTSYHSPLTDTDYERLPQQILSLVKVGEPRYVVYAWGQSLKPADNVPGIGVGIDPATKVVRNYQITGEMATRAVVRVEFDKDPFGRTDYRRPHAVVESFNILPNE